MNPKIKKLAVTLLKTAVTISICFLLYLKLDFKYLGQILLTCNYLYLVPAIFAFIISKIISSVRLNHFLKAIDVNLSEKTNLKLYWLGMYYNLFLPGGIGGDGFKVYLLQKNFNSGTRKILTAILLDRITGVLALFGLLVILSFCLPIPYVYKLVSLACVPIVFAGFYQILKKFYPVFVGVFKRTNTMSFGVQIAQLLCTWLIIMALRHQEDIATYLLVFLISSVVAVVPFTIGGIGSRELTFLLAAQYLHLNINISVTISLLFFLITATVSFWGVIYSFNNLEIKNIE